MKNHRFVLSFVLLSALFSASCGGGSSETLSRQTFSFPSVTSSAESKPSASEEEGPESAHDTPTAEGSGVEETISSEAPQKEDLVSELPETEYRNFPEHYLRKLSSFSTFKAVTKGDTKAKVLFIETTQSIDVTLIKSDYSYMKNESHSSLVNTVHECYFHGDKTLYRDADSGDFTLSGLNDYLNIYGVYPFDNAIEGYNVFGDGLLSIERKQSEADHVFVIKVDPVKATTNVRIQMKKFGGLDDYPVFKDIEITLTVKDNYTPVSLHLESNYSAKKMMDSDCHQSYDVIFSDFNEKIEVPGLENVKDKFA